MAKREGKHLYKIIAHGDFVPVESVAAALAALGHQVVGQETAYTLHNTLSQLPPECPDFARRCYEYLSGCDEPPDLWGILENQVYLNVESAIGAMFCDQVAETAERVMELLSGHMDLFEAEQAACRLMTAVLGWPDTKADGENTGWSQLTLYSDAS